MVLILSSYLLISKLCQEGFYCEQRQNKLCIIHIMYYDDFQHNKALECNDFIRLKEKTFQLSTSVLQYMIAPVLVKDKQ